MSHEAIEPEKRVFRINWEMSPLVLQEASKTHFAVGNLTSGFFFIELDVISHDANRFLAKDDSRVGTVLPKALAQLRLMIPSGRFCFCPAPRGRGVPAIPIFLGDLPSEYAQKM